MGGELLGGLGADPEATHQLTHVTWADNIFLLSHSAQHLGDMMQELTSAIYASGLRWRDTSLEVMLSQQVECEHPGLFVMTSDIELLEYTSKSETVILGNLTDRTGNTAASLNY